MSILRPFGNLLKAIDLKLYVHTRWFLKSIMGNPMSQQFLLPLLVRKGETVLDIGANVGQLTLPLAKIVGNNGAVFAFEPIANNYQNLTMNILAGELDTIVKTFKLGLSDCEKKATFIIPNERMTEATLVPHKVKSWAEIKNPDSEFQYEDCDITTLDKFIEFNNIENIAFIKCDVEGAELSVLKGAENLLSSSSPPIIMLEAYEGWTKDFGYTPIEMFRYLNSIAGYEIYWINSDGLTLIDLADDTVPGIYYQWLDFICYVPGLHSNKFSIKKFLTR